MGRSEWGTSSPHQSVKGLFGKGLWSQEHRHCLQPHFVFVLFTSQQSEESLIPV